MPCIDGWRKDFGQDEKTGERGKCVWWKHVTGKDPQSEKQLDLFDCAIAWMPVIGLENSQRIMHVGVATQEVRNTLIDLAPEDAAKGAMAKSAYRMLVQGTAPAITGGEINQPKVDEAVKQLKEINEVDNGTISSPKVS
jgi:hypothetical protein